MTPQRSSVTRLVASVVYVTAWPALMFVLAGDVRWIEGWLFTAWLLGLYAIVTTWMYLKDPALLAERRKPERRDAVGIERQDRLLLRLLFLGFALWIVLMPLDARRFGWTPGFPPGISAAGAALLLIAAFLLFRAFYDNTFLSGVARIQSDRRQHVVSSGVYAFVRHPMYLGMLLMFAGAPLLLGSGFGLLVAGALAALLAVRITREERLLRGELAGYDSYCHNVRWRLVPFVW